MTQMPSGIHHVTLSTRKVQDNVDFYAGFLGLRLVKRTAGFEDAAQLHLFYGDAVASPGSLVTFLVWEDGAPGRVGHGRSEEHTSELQSLMRISYAVFCLKKKNTQYEQNIHK